MGNRRAGPEGTEALHFTMATGKLGARSIELTEELCDVNHASTPRPATKQLAGEETDRD